ncbi:hypothetical protein EYR41_010344 [Orbilia oligospora]|uniref:Uncharacterized protein n=1 Tax=Orbilia oligospora TaxID=2813651 RepID=A0A7C8P3T3_ORBOL|nr:hypothetical protein TWF751_011389 [Orbilia oligospora]KAF3296951.1 hypothetical protein TWF132_009443 [Orbilia oligospora]TGJ64281.1 hypothetical protein EYR41_010344 [Orbilia oligospora]
MHKPTPLLTILPTFSSGIIRARGSKIEEDSSIKKRKRTLITSLPSSTSHTDIPSFLRHADISSLNPTTTVFTGTLYEYTVLAALTRCLPGISLTRVGGRDDAGVDLLGQWELPRIPRRRIPITTTTTTIPSTNNNTNNNNNCNTSENNNDNNNDPTNPPENNPEILPLTIQCKNVQQKSWKGPQYIRELEGALASRPHNALGILASVRDITPGMKKQMLASRRALGFVKVTPLEAIYGGEILIQKYGDHDGGLLEFKLTGRGGLLQQFAWNEVANRYIGGFGIGARYVERDYAVKDVELGEFMHKPEKMKARKREEGEEEEEEEELEQEITLTWNGTPISLKS